MIVKHICNLDFATSKEKWVDTYSVGKYFESPLTHVQGNPIFLLEYTYGLFTSEI